MGAAERKSKWLMSFSMIIWGTLGLFTRQISLPSGELALYRAVLAIILIGALLLITRQKIDFALVKRELLLLLFSGIAMGINWVLLFEAYNRTSVSVATLSYYFAPVIVTALSSLLFRERLTKKQLFCFIMSTLGIFLIIGAEGFSGKGDMPGILCGLGAACFYALVVLLNKYIKGVAGLHRTLMQMLGALVILLPYVLISGNWGIGTLDFSGIFALLIVGLLHTGVNYCIYFSSIKSLSGQSVAILSYLDPLVAVLVSVFLLGESMSAAQWLGGALVLGFTLFNELRKAK